MDRRGDGEKQGGVEGGYTIIRVYYMGGVFSIKMGKILLSHTEESGSFVNGTRGQRVQHLSLFVVL